MFHQDSFKTEGLVCLETDRRTDRQTDEQRGRRTDRRTWLYRHRPDQENIYFMGSVRPSSMRYKLRGKN